MAMRAIGRAMVAVLCCLPLWAHAAKPLKSPAAELRSRYTVIASGVVERVDARLALGQVQPVDGRPEPGESLELRIPEWLAPRLAVGERVLVAYTPFRRDPTLVDRRILDGDGPRLLLVAGLEPALLRDTPESRARLLGADGAARHPTLEEALRGLRDPDPQWQNYYAHELALAPTLRPKLDAQHRAPLAALIADEDAHPSARALWLRLADTLPGDDARWWHGAALEVLARTSTDALDDPLANRAALVRAAFDALERAQVAVPTPVLSRWVGSAQAALVESALLAARRSAPETEDALIERALARALLPAPTRGFLLDHRRRLALMREALARREAGDNAGSP